MIKDRRRHKDWLHNKEQNQRLESALKLSKEARNLTKEAQKLVAGRRRARKLFQKYDPERTGSITAKKLRQVCHCVDYGRDPSSLKRVWPLHPPPPAI